MLHVEHFSIIDKLKKKRQHISNRLLKLDEYIYKNSPRIQKIDAPAEDLTDTYLAYCMMEAQALRLQLIALHYRIVYLEKHVKQMKQK